MNNFNTPVAQTITVNGIAVAVSPPSCLGVAIAENYTAINNITLYDTNWAVTATAADPLIRPTWCLAKTLTGHMTPY